MQQQQQTAASCNVIVAATMNNRMESVKNLIIMRWRCFSHACTFFFPLVLHANWQLFLLCCCRCQVNELIIGQRVHTPIDWPRQTTAMS